MSSQAIAIVLFSVIAALIVLGFLLLWWRDKRNADQIQSDPERLDTTTEHWTEH